MSELSNTNKLTVAAILLDAVGYHAEATRLGDVSPDIQHDPQIAEGRAHNKFSTGRRTRLMYAAHAGNVSDAIKLLQLGADIDAQDSRGFTALMYAVESGHPDMVRFLCESGASLDLLARIGITALHIAIPSGRLDIVHILCEQGINVDLSPEMSPIWCAATCGQFDIVCYLAEHGAYLNLYHFCHMETPLTLVTGAGDIRTVRTLVRCGANVDLDTRDRGTALCIAIKHGHTALAHYLIEQGANIDATFGLGPQTPLSLAIQAKDFEMVRIFKEKGADFSDFDDGATLYGFAYRVHGETDPFTLRLKEYLQFA